MDSITIEDWSVVATSGTLTTAVFDLSETPEPAWEEVLMDTALPPGIHEVELDGASLVVTCAARVRTPELESLISDLVDEVDGDT